MKNPMTPCMLDGHLGKKKVVERKRSRTREKPFENVKKRLVLLLHHQFLSPLHTEKRERKRTKQV
jgi:hypothetical protein